MRLGALALAFVLFASPLTAEGQKGAALVRVGVLSPGSPPLGALDAFRRGLHELGYVEGRNIAIEWRFAEGRSARLSELAAELVRLNVNVIVAVNTPPALAAKTATQTIPIVITRVADPMRVGLVTSLGRPGGNVTGISVITAELSAKRLELLREAIPSVSRVALLWSTGNPGTALAVREVELASLRLGMQLQILGVQGPGDFRNAFESATGGRADALYVIDDVIITSHRTQLVSLALRSGLPVMSQYAEFTEAGGLMAYGPSIPEMYRRAAIYVDKILKGAKPADLPVEQPTTFELVVNLKTAKALGLTIPPSLLLRADRVIE